MICSCRTAPLRLFVNSLAQLHISEAAATRTVTRLPQAPRLVLARRDAFSTTARHCDAPNTIMKDAGNDFQVEDNVESASPQKQESPVTRLDSAAATEVPRASSSTDTTTSSFRKARAKTSKQSSATTATPYSTPRPPLESWQSQKSALKEKFPDGWRPLKRLSPDAVAGIRALHAQFPDEYTTPALARQFEVSPEAIRRILKSKWTPTVDEEEKRQERWFRRGKSVWSRYAELGMKPPQKWRKEGVTRDPTWHEKRQAAIMRRRQEEESRGTGAMLHRTLGGAIM